MCVLAIIINNRQYNYFNIIVRSIFSNILYMGHTYPIMCNLVYTMVVNKLIIKKAGQKNIYVIRKEHFT